MLGLKRHEARDGPEIIAEMQIAGGLNAGEYASSCLGLLHRLSFSRGYGVGREGAQASSAGGRVGVEFGECQ